MWRKLSRNAARKQKHFRARYKINGTASKPRLNVFKSHQNFYAQLIDDVKGITLASVSTLSSKEYSGNIESARKIGLLMGDKINKLGFKEVVFDRGGYIFHGRVKAFAESVREKGVKF
ncbi:50S ribosomal protein L18 [Mycoplasmopsis cynos]|uniref:50S ribosomal protein L18 n=1 Tax=Mycoplasmopsis cynos TaxID=171284 RepID=UPI0022038D60|nr:50S ribosomal protein L18 [Mycoplasmopsis cynos]MCU9935712.1 50S ribosomal protein L18 [Mycoplasmopsis cynos]UWV82098.1 50S ribosomal protein L18 [Mycoplasmopsis cynos]WAM05176.1 50S ribosomal protein L18 [Mycoplasmopsis cynos]WAM08322.1 50S ribosomal protein L18 [Mycoplasmopsis cynos]WAM10407.1 50S ribosomal protein L18 [Mycoplasmopsis cynos]